MGFFRVNFDAAVFEEIQKIGFGVVVLDEHRLFIGPLSLLEYMSTDAEEAEVMAVMQATEFAMPFWSNYRRWLVTEISSPQFSEPNLSKIEHLLDLVKQNGLFQGDLFLTCQ